jgi:hypothetical protein
MRLLRKSASSRIQALLLASALSTCVFGHADMIEFGSITADGTYMHWIGQTTGTARNDSVRAAIAVDPLRVRLPGALSIIAGDASILSSEVVIGTDLVTGNVELTRAKATLLRAMILQQIPTELLTGYRDLDRGIAWGLDLVGIRVPFRLGPNGEIVIQPGLELGVRHYESAAGAPSAVNATTAHAALTLDASAATELIEGWLSTGILAQVRAEAVTEGMSGIQASGTGFLSLALDNNQRLHLRLYGGAQYDSNRENLGMQPAALFGGLGIFGNFGTR